eukprot:364223-Chlamydomonas_euryale.AAC.7
MQYGCVDMRRDCGDLLFDCPAHMRMIVDVPGRRQEVSPRACSRRVQHACQWPCSACMHERGRACWRRAATHAWHGPHTHERQACSRPWLRGLPCGPAPRQESLLLHASVWLRPMCRARRHKCGWFRGIASCAGHGGKSVAGFRGIGVAGSEASPHVQGGEA